MISVILGCLRFLVIFVQRLQDFSLILGILGIFSRFSMIFCTPRKHVWKQGIPKVIRCLLYFCKPFCIDKWVNLDNVLHQIIIKFVPVIFLFFEGLFSFSDQIWQSWQLTLCMKLYSLFTFMTLWRASAWPLAALAQWSGLTCKIFLKFGKQLLSFFGTKELLVFKNYNFRMKAIISVNKSSIFHRGYLKYVISIVFNKLEHVHFIEGTSLSNNLDRIVN